MTGHLEPQTSSITSSFHDEVLIHGGFMFVKLSWGQEKQFKKSLTSSQCEVYVAERELSGRGSGRNTTAHIQWGAKPGSKTGSEKTFFGICAR